MIASIAVGAVILVVLIRFVHPALAYRVRDLVVEAKINRQLIAAMSTDLTAKHGSFRGLLEKTLRSQVGASDPQAMKMRCLRIREVLGIMAARSGDPNGSAPADLGATIIELAEMVHVLGIRIRPGLDLDVPAVGAEHILLTAARTFNAEVEIDTLEDWLSEHALSVEQIGELLIAAVYALACREEIVALEA